MELTTEQLNQLNLRCPRMPIRQLLQYIDTYANVSLDNLTELPDERRSELKELLKDRPNQQEQQEWNLILPQMARMDDSFKLMLESYVNNWEFSQPKDNHVAEAQTKIQEIINYQRIIAAEREEADWNHIWEVNDAGSTRLLLEHLRKYPSTTHLDEIDEGVWNNVLLSTNKIKSAQEYEDKFPKGLHIDEVSKLKSEYLKWTEIKNTNLYAVKEYISENPHSAYLLEAKILLADLKNKEIEKMREQGSTYSIDELFTLLEKGIFTEAELCDENVITVDALQILADLTTVKDNLPDINTEIAKCQNVCAPNRTDVFLFGIPSTGKSCILMGLIGSSAIDISYVRAGGPYAAGLQQYLDAGFTIGQTPVDFVATLEASISDVGSTHYINLVEMAGEDFAFKIADNEDGKVSFEDMGAGATQLLCNNNRKVFFLIVDPTASVVAFNHLVPRKDTEGNYIINENGNVSYEKRRFNVNQRITMKKMVDLLSLPENSSILKKVDSIHVIVTKADVFGQGIDREDKAYERFMNRHKNIIEPLTKLCRENGINATNNPKTNGVPRLYTFSLGNFYVGGIYQYDSTDADKLIEVMKGNTEIIKDRTFLGKLRDFFTKPII